MSTRYPIGYRSTLVTLDYLRSVHEPKMHPEFSRRLWPWLESMDGLIGIGGGWRDVQPDKPGFAPDGKSFHQSQTWASGLSAYAAVDLVARNGTNIHRSPTWSESATAPNYGLHTFISGEPWHMQPVETRGWQSWVNGGRRDPDNHFQVPGLESNLMISYRKRVHDSRPNEPLPGGTSRQVDVGPYRTVLLSVVAVNPTADGWLAVWGEGPQPQPYSNLNFAKGKASNAVVFTEVATDGTVRVWSSADTHIVVDIQGYTR